MQLADPPSAVASPVSDWGLQVLEPATAIQDAVARLKASANASNLKGAKEACQQLRDSAQQVTALLPAPTEALTNEVSQGMSELRPATRICLSSGPIPSLNEINTVEKHLDKAIGYMENAKSMVARG